MKILLSGSLLLLANMAFAQKPVKPAPKSISAITQTDVADAGTRDSLIKEKLVALAYKNPSVVATEASIKSAEYSLKKARSSWLSAIALGGNVNEFAITNNNQASFFPRYNFGASIPFDIFSRTGNEKKIANQNIIINKELRQSRMLQIKAEVLTRYENYKEKKELVRLQKISMESDYQAYMAAQKDYTEGNMQLNEMNKIYQTYISEQAKLVTKEKELTIAVIQLEEIIGIPLETALTGL